MLLKAPKYDTYALQGCNHYIVYQCKNRENMKEFKVKAYGKSELAMLYFPDAGSAHTAVNHLMSWIHRNPELSEELKKMGYRKSDKFFTPKQVAVIAEYLGEP